MKTKKVRIEFLILSILVLIIGYGLFCIIQIRQPAYPKGDNIVWGIDVGGVEHFCQEVYANPMPPVCVFATIAVAIILLKRAFRG